MSHLDELDAIAKVIDDLLISFRRPPLNGKVISTSGTNQPIGHILPRQLTDRGGTGTFGLGKVNVAMECARFEL
jgi:hypothetical protein